MPKLRTNALARLLPLTGYPTRRWTRVVFVAHALLAAIQTEVAAALPWEVWESPARFAAVDPTHALVTHSSFCPDGCRYDRSNRGPESALDNPYPLRWLYRTSADEVVLLDERGPGALTRFWMTTGDGVSRCIDPAIRVRIHVDAASTPTLDVPLAALFDGTQIPFTSPLVEDRLGSSGGYVSRVPIAYASSLRVSLVNAESGNSACDPSGWGLLWYQFNVDRLRPGTAVEPFAPDVDLSAYRNFLDTTPGDDPWNGMLAPHAFAGSLTPGMSMTLASDIGSGSLRGIRLQVPAYARPLISIRLRFDGELAVDMPLDAFFGTSATAATRSLLFGEDTAGSLYAWWPMPYAQSLQVELAMVGPLGMPPTAISGSLSFDAPVADAARFHAQWRSQCLASGDMPVFADSGAGKIVALSARYAADGVIDRAYLEGDERIYVDHAITPVAYGTGVEDLHDGGFYFDQGPFLRALSGASAVDADGSQSTLAYRLFATDPISYTSAIRITQEAGLSPVQGVPMCARHVLFGYRVPRASTVRLAQFDVGSAAATALHAYVPPPGAVCSPLQAQFVDEPPTARDAIVCRSGSGSSTFRFNVNAAAHGLRLRRIVDAGDGVPGTIAGAPSATVRINGIEAGTFPPVASNPLRRWQQQEILLAEIPHAGALEIAIAPQSGAHAAMHSESQWELRGAWIDAIYSDGFDAINLRYARAAGGAGEKKPAR